MPNKIRELFGFDFSELLEQLGEPKKVGTKRSKKTPVKRGTAKANTKGKGQKQIARKS